MADRILWTLVGFFALFSAVKPWLAGTPLFPLVPALSVLVPIVFVLIHAPRLIGWKRLALFFALTFAISWSYESLSIATGFPFGHYHYSDKIGPKLGTVPLRIMPAYFGICYICWLIAGLLLDTGRGDGRTAKLLPRVVTAAFVMVMWDLSMDPARSTVGKVWIWHDGGAYFGVPLVNFFGWFLCVATIFLAYGALATRVGAPPQKTPNRAAYAQALGLYAALFVEYAAYLFVAATGVAVDAAGQNWGEWDIYQSLGLVSIFTMGFVVWTGWQALQRGKP